MISLSVADNASVDFSAVLTMAEVNALEGHLPEIVAFGTIDLLTYDNLFDTNKGQISSQEFEELFEVEVEEELWVFVRDLVEDDCKVCGRGHRWDCETGTCVLKDKIPDRTEYYYASFQNPDYHVYACTEEPYDYPPEVEMHIYAKNTVSGFCSLGPQAIKGDMEAEEWNDFTCVIRHEMFAMAEANFSSTIDNLFYSCDYTVGPLQNPTCQDEDGGWDLLKEVTITNIIPN